MNKFPSFCLAPLQKCCHVDPAVDLFLQLLHTNNFAAVHERPAAVAKMPIWTTGSGVVLEELRDGERKEKLSNVLQVFKKKNKIKCWQ